MRKENVVKIGQRDDPLMMAAAYHWYYYCYGTCVHADGGCFLLQRSYHCNHGCNHGCSHHYSRHHYWHVAFQRLVLQSPKFLMRSWSHWIKRRRVAVPVSLHLEEVMLPNDVLSVSKEFFASGVFLKKEVWWVEDLTLRCAGEEPTFPKIGIKNANNFWNCSGRRRKKFWVRKNFSASSHYFN